MNQMRSTPAIVLLLVISHLGLFAWFSTYTAEDAYIVYRYSENLVDGNGLAFNPGEPVSALTSPLHALICSGLYAITGESAWTNKVFAALLHLACTYLAVQLIQLDRGRLLFFLMVWLSPYMIFWTAGGLETMYLSSFLVVAFACSVRSHDTDDCRFLIAFSVLLGLAFLTRYDSCLFTLPIWFHVAISQWRRAGLSRGQKVVRTVLLLMPGLVMALAWLGTSYVYYHDIFPTSIYHKPLRYDIQTHAAFYMLQFLCLSGIVPLLAWVSIDRTRRPGTRFFSSLTETTLAKLGVVIGLLIFAFYATTAVLTHMMFSYRFLLPYFPIMTLLVIELIHRSSPEAWQGGNFGRRSWLWVLMLVIPFQGLQFYLIDQHSINPGKMGEYRQLSRQQYRKFMDILSVQASAIKDHWESGDHKRAPQIHVYAAGILPYQYRDAYIVDWGLISYRKNVEVYSIQPGLLYSSDYIMTLSPRHHGVDYQLQQSADGLQLITETRMVFDGSEQTFSIWHNATPSEYRLPSTVDGAAITPIPEPIQ